MIWQILTLKFAISLCGALKIRTSGLQIYIKALQWKFDLIEKIYFDLDFTKSPVGFISLFVVCPQLPFKTNLQEAILRSKNFEEITQFVNLETNLKGSNISVDSILEYAPLFHPYIDSKLSETVDKLKYVTALPNDPPMMELSLDYMMFIIKSLGRSHNLLSTRSIYNGMPKRILDIGYYDAFLQKHLWNLIDNECLLENPNLARLLFGKFIYPEAIDVKGVGGLEPLARIIQCIAIRDLIQCDPRSYTVFDDDHDRLDSIVNDQLQKAFSRFSLFTEAYPNKNPLHILYWSAKNHLSPLAKNLSRHRLSNNEFALKYFTGLWKILSGDILECFQTNRVLVHMLIMLSRIEAFLPWIRERVNWIISRPLHLSPVKEMFQLLILFSRKIERNSFKDLGERDQKFVFEIIDSIWNTGIISPYRHDNLIKLYPQYYGYLMRFIKDLAEKRAIFRSFQLESYRTQSLGPPGLRHIWLELGKAYLARFRDLYIWPERSFSNLEERRNGVLKMFRLILKDFFFYANHESYKGRQCYLPRVDIHPFIELLFWSLVDHAIILNIDLPFIIHPRYVEFIFGEHLGNGSNPQRLVKLLNHEQYGGRSSLSMADLINSIAMLDAMHSQLWGDRCGIIEPTFTDFLEIAGFSHRCVSVYKRLNGNMPTKQNLDQLRLHAKFMTLTVWTAKTRRIVGRLRPGSISDPYFLTTLFFPRAAKIPRQVFETPDPLVHVQKDKLKLQE